MHNALVSGKFRSLLILFFLVGVLCFELVNASEFSLPKPQACSVAGNFVQHRQVSGLSFPLVSEGVYFHHCELGVVWATTQPVREIWVMRHDEKNIMLTDDVIAPLNDRYSELLSPLLRGLMAGNVEQLQSAFDMRFGEKDHWHLTPSGRMFKRAIKYIAITEQAAKSEQLRSFMVTIADTKGQLTEISTNQWPLGDGDASSLLASCQAAGISAEACNALFD